MALDVVGECLDDRAWAERVDIAVGDVLEPATLPAAFENINVTYYLVHSMTGSTAFEERDERAAQNFGEAAREAGVKRIIYLGGLGDSETDLSKHLRSRQKTGEILRASGVAVTEFRAAVIVGSGSVSFEMIRYLTERLPVMICPRWVYTRTQPIAIRDVLSYLVAALRTPASADRIVEIGGRNVLTYGEMMKGYARVRGLRRFLIPVPLLTPNLSSYWVHWVTPIPAQISQPLIMGLRNEAIVTGDAARTLFPDIQPMEYEDAVRQALQRIEAGEVDTLWTDALASSQNDRPPTTLVEKEGIIMERYSETIDAPAQAVFDTFTGLGGANGWLYATWLWRLRGLIDRLFGGVGFLRRRRNPNELREGDALDFWRVEKIQRDRLLRMRAEMKLPGDAWLEFEVRSVDGNRSRLTQTAYFAPKGLGGLAYWYGLYPVHRVIFRNLIRRVKRRAEEPAVEVD
jgi:uncharacterized protein YbjT (DUF2867 family)